MDKMDEMILAVDRYSLFENETLAFQGVLTLPAVVNRIMKKFESCEVVRRGDVEHDITFKQPIPYVVLKRGDEIFTYKRLSGGGEARLHDQLSIGVGGHMNHIDNLDNWNSIMLANIYRELTEELDFGLDEVADIGYLIEPKTVGLINDDKGNAGLYHIGILMVMELPENAEVTVRETEELEGRWMKEIDLLSDDVFNRLESWSKFAVEVL